MQLDIPIDVTITSQASSQYDLPIIEARLAKLATMSDLDEVRRERTYLQELKAKEF